jgi:WD40 repeat protein/serine/threonine protein kinase
MSNASATMDSLVLGGFALKQQIGEGGFGTVYLAEQLALGRPAVVKVMRRSLAGRRAAVERFVLEARLASRLDHPCAAHIYAFGAEPDGTLWIAMELVKGTSLDRLLESGPLPIERVIPLLERLCEAVQMAHEQGIVHRDIKPGNVMVTAKGGRLMPKLLDFGIAKQLVSGDSEPTAVRAKAPTLPPTPLPMTFERPVQSTGDGGSSDSLTQAGQLLGSPAYMAPEQWIDPSLVGAWTDQYALALVAWETLAGTRARNGSSVSALAAQHLETPLPRSPQIPEAVHAVLARAAAKEPKHRFPDLGQFVHALQAAAGWSTEPEEPVPTLRAELSTIWLADAPQPVAEAIAALVTARSGMKLTERIGAASSVIARWLGVLAVACRSRIGPLSPHSVHDVLRGLRRQAPRAEDWLDLACELCRDFADRPEAWPIPELASWCTDPHAVDALRQLVRGEAVLVDDDTAIRRRAIVQLAALEGVLDRLGWLLDYEIGHEVPGGIELWMGPPSNDRVVRPGPSEGDRVVVLDADGARVALLSPLVQIAAAVPGEPEELFVFTGPSRTGDAGLYSASPRGFEREDAAIWPWLAEHLLDADRGRDVRTGEDRPPYPGLAAFTAEDHGSYFGRERDVIDLVNRLRSQPIVAVVGPSGAGKSSFLAAGVTPALPASWIAITIRPGRDPIAMLESVSDRVDAPYRDAPRSATSSSPAELAGRLIAIARRRAVTLVLIVDQAEELFTQGATDDQRTAFAEAAVALAASPHARVVLGMRDDFLCRVDDLGPWRGTIGRSVQILGVPSRADLERIIIEPARVRGYELEDSALPKKMIDEVAGRTGTLSLLSFAAAELWERRDRHFKRITKAAYVEIGGVTGALVKHADGVVDTMTTTDRRLVRLAFRRLLTAEGARIVHDRGELVAALGGGTAATNIVERLLAARLLVSRDEDAGERVEIVHEALTTTWPLLAKWRDEDASGSRLHEQLAAAARHWDERGRADGLVWRDDALDELRRWRGANDAGMTPVEDAFVKASEAAARRTRRRRLAMIGTAFVVLGAAIVVLALFNRQIASQRKDAVHRVAASFEERGRVALGEGVATHALLYLAEASRLGVSGPSHDLLVARAATSVESLEAIEVRDAQPFNDAGIAGTLIGTWQGNVGRLWDRTSGQRLVSIPDAITAVAGDALATLSLSGDVMVTERSGKVRWRVERGQTGTVDRLRIRASVAGDAVFTQRGPIVRVWGLGDGSLRGALEHPEPVRSADFSASGRKIASVDGSGTIRLWDVATASLQASCSIPGLELQSVVTTPAEDRIIASGGDGTIRICDVATGQIVRTLSGHRAVARGLDLDRDGRVLVSASMDGTARLWDLNTGESLGVLVGHRGAVRIVELSPDGRRVATGGEDATIRIWDVESAAQVGLLQGHEARIASLHWDEPDHLISASFDGTIRRWNVGRRTDLIARGHSKIVEQLVLSPDRALTLTVGDDGVAIVWDVASVRRRSVLPAEVKSGAFLDATRIATAGADGRVQLWSIDGAALAAFASGDASLHRLVVDHTGKRFATVSSDGMVRLWRGDGTAHAAHRLGFAIAQVQFDPSDRWLAIAGTGTAGVTILDATTLRPVTTLLAGTNVQQFSIDRTRIGATHDRSATLIELGTWKTVTTLEGHRSWVDKIDLLPDGRTITTSDDATVRIWDRAGRSHTTLPVAGKAFALGVSPDGMLLGVGTGEGATEIWDLPSNRLLLTLRGHRLATYWVAFAGSRVVTGGEDGRVASWDLGHRTRSHAELAKLVKCRVPLALDGEIAIPRHIDDDPACR